MASDSHEAKRVPMFPLGVVLFPGSVLPLHIFEDRYKRLTQDCVSNQSPFGVVLIERGQDGLEEMLEIAKSSEHPRAMEVFGQLIGKLTETNKELLNLHKTKKDISAEDSGPKNVSNNLFVGSTAELQKFLKTGKTIKENE